MSPINENEDCEFVSHFFPLNLNLESQNKKNNDSKFENDVFCFTGLLQSLFDSEEEMNTGVNDDGFESRSDHENNDKCTVKEILSTVVDDCNQINNDNSDVDHVENIINVARFIRMDPVNLLKDTVFISKYFINTSNDFYDSNVLSDINNSFKDQLESNKEIYNLGVTKENFVTKEDKESEFEAVACRNIETVYEDCFPNKGYSEEIDESSLEDREFRMSQLDPRAEIITIKPFFNISPRKMPSSPHGIMEEEFKSNPWVMLVVTIFLTKTTGKAARPLMKEFFSTYPTPYEVLHTDPADLERFFVNLGMRKRAHMIWRMSYEFVSAKWRRASDLHGIGKYGEDAYRIFCLGHTDIEPTDRYLRLYLDWLKSQTDHDEVLGTMDSECVIMDPVYKYYSITLR